MLFAQRPSASDALEVSAGFTCRSPNSRLQRPVKPPIFILTDESVKNDQSVVVVPKIVDKQAKRLEIVEAAITVFARAGYRSATMAQVAAQAQIGKGTIYEYFSSKADLLTAAFELFQNLFEQRIQNEIAIIPSPLDQLRALVRTCFSVFEDRPELLRLFNDFWVAAVYDGTFPIDFAAMYRQYRTMVCDMLHNAAEQGEVDGNLPEMSASIILACIDGIFLQWTFDQEAVDLSQAAASIDRIISQGIELKESR